MKERGDTHSASASGFSQKFPRIQILTIEQLMAGVAVERPRGNVAVDETFKKAPKAKDKGTGQNELNL